MARALADLEARAQDREREAATDMVGFKGEADKQLVCAVAPGPVLSGSTWQLLAPCTSTCFSDTFFHSRVDRLAKLKYNHKKIT